MVAESHLKVIHCPGVVQLADGLTKPLQATIFQRIRKLTFMMARPGSDPLVKRVLPLAPASGARSTSDYPAHVSVECDARQLDRRDDSQKFPSKLGTPTPQFLVSSIGRGCSQAPRLGRRASHWRLSRRARPSSDSGEKVRSSRFDLRDPSRPGLVGDKPQSGEPSVTAASTLLLRFSFGVTKPASNEPPKDETPGEMVQRLEREKMNADIAKAAASGKAAGFIGGSWGDGRVTERLHRASFAMHERLAEELDRVMDGARGGGAPHH